MPRHHRRSGRTATVGRIVDRERDDSWLLSLLHEAADVIAGSLGELERPVWGRAGNRPGQYHADLIADAAVVALLDAAGVGALTEESGLHHPERSLLVVVDPLDGSTNAAYGLPWYAASLCAFDGDGPRAAVVADLARDVRFEAARGNGARRNGLPVRPSGCDRVAEAVVGLSGWPPAHLGWLQYRALGAIALDLCAVACGALDGFVDCSPDAHGVWDYAGGLLVCEEAGAVVADAFARDLVIREPAVRRTPVAAATPALLEALVAARATYQ